MYCIDPFLDDYDSLCVDVAIGEEVAIPLDRDIGYFVIINGIKKSIR